MIAGPTAYAVLSAVVLMIGLGGVASRRQPASQVCCLGIALTAPIIAAAGFSSGGPITDSPFGDGLAAIAAVALDVIVLVAGAALLLLRRRAGDVDLDIEAGPSLRRTGD